ncbi:hypothetical protein [Shinella sp. DD12]|jgi:hypothetical protein|nr:hypothetical protein [Shinella sp. DD12]MCA0341377.1 hypothetical protein [Pseudomonadota bacterium]
MDFIFHLKKSNYPNVGAAPLGAPKFSADFPEAYSTVSQALGERLLYF